MTSRIGTILFVVAIGAAAGAVLGGGLFMTLNLWKSEWGNPTLPLEMRELDIERIEKWERGNERIEHWLQDVDGELLKCIDEGTVDLGRFRRNMNRVLYRFGPMGEDMHDGFLDQYYPDDIDKETAFVLDFMEAASSTCGIEAP